MCPVLNWEGLGSWTLSFSRCASCAIHCWVMDVWMPGCSWLRCEGWQLWQQFTGWGPAGHSGGLGAFSTYSSFCQLIDLPGIPTNTGTESRSGCTKIDQMYECPPQPPSGAVVHMHWSRMRERSIMVWKYVLFNSDDSLVPILSFSVAWSFEV